MLKVLKVLGVLVTVLAMAAGAAAVSGQAADWGQWRGPARDGVVAARTTWPASLRRVWSVAAGAGYSTPIAAEGRVFVHERQDDREVVRALDLATGRETWRDAYPAPYTVNRAAAGHGPGPKSTPVFAAGSVCTLGISGILSCYDAGTGKLGWRHPSDEQPLFGTAMSPLVDGDTVIAHLGGQERGALTAFDLRSGAVRWRWPAPPAYASPVVGTFGGVRQIVTFSRTHLAAVSADRGALLWQVPFTTPYDQNAVTPLVVGDLVVYSGLDQGIAAVRPVKRGATWTAEPVWKAGDVSMYMSSPVVAGGLLFGLSHRNRGQFFALDTATGRTLWTTTGREAENAALVRSGDHVLALTTAGELRVFKAGATYEVVRRYEVASSVSWAHPAFAGTRIVVRDASSVALWE